MMKLSYRVIERDPLRNTIRIEYSDGVNVHVHSINLPPVVPDEDYEEVTIPARITEVGRGVAVKLAQKAATGVSSTQF